MPGKKPKPPSTHPVRTSLYDAAWDDVDTATPAEADVPEPPARPQQPPRPEWTSVTEVDDLLDELQPEDTLATVRRADVLPGLGGPPEVTASPLGGPAPFRVGPPSEPPLASSENLRPLQPPTPAPRSPLPPAPLPPPRSPLPPAPLPPPRSLASPPRSPLPPPRQVSPPLPPPAAALPPLAPPPLAPPGDALRRGAPLLSPPPPPPLPLPSEPELRSASAPMLSLSSEPELRLASEPVLPLPDELAASELAQASAWAPTAPLPVDSSRAPPSRAANAIHRALSKRASVAGFAAKLGPVLLSALAVLLFAAVALGFAIGFGLGRSGARHSVVAATPLASAPAMPPSAAASATPSSAAASGTPTPVPAPTPTLAEVPPPVASTILGRAAQGDSTALAQIEKRPARARTVDETVAIAAGREATTAHALDALGKKLKQDPAKFDNPSIDRQLIGFARNPRTDWRALRIIAEFENTRSADLLYAVWSGAPHTESAELAKALLATHVVRQHASPALAVVLELRRAHTCAAVKRLLPRVQANGDRRALYVLGKVRYRRGCGPHKRKDCYACLRHGHELSGVIHVVEKRAPPAL